MSLQIYFPSPLRRAGFLYYLPNGSKFAYGHAKDGTVTAITHSTENGEENSTTKIYDGDLLTELKSGNNTVKYSYDEKRRVSAVELNGKSDYVSYSYDGEHTTKKICFQPLS